MQEDLLSALDTDSPAANVIEKTFNENPVISVSILINIGLENFHFVITIKNYLKYILKQYIHFTAIIEQYIFVCFIKRMITLRPSLIGR